MANASLRAVSIALALTACGSKAPPSPATPVITTAPPTPVPAPAPVETRLPEPVAPPPEPPPTPPTPPPPPAPPEIAKACRGATLDLAKLVKIPACHVQAPAMPIPPTITVALSPSVVATMSGKYSVASGRSLDAAVVLTNTTDAEIVLVLEDCIDDLTEITYEMTDAKGVRVDSGLDGCGRGGSCSNNPLGIAIAPKGTARIPFKLAARFEVVDDGCTHQRGGKPVPRGTYELTVRSQLGEFKSGITVR